jgi:hypothetical protein
MKRARIWLGVFMLLASALVGAYVSWAIWHADLVCVEACDLRPPPIGLIEIVGAVVGAAVGFMLFKLATRPREETR